MRRFKGVIALVAPLALVLMLSMPAAHAAGPGGGAVVFSGTANLPTFPCAGTCNGTFNGTASGTLAGVDTGNGNTPWSVTFANSTLSSTFTYDEPASTCPVQGTANGNIGISGGTITGNYGATTISTASANGTFVWTRVGATAIIETTISVTVGGHAVIVNAKDRAVAAFATQGVPDCASPGPITASVVGTDVIEPAPDPLP